MGAGVGSGVWRELQAGGGVCERREGGAPAGSWEAQEGCALLQGRHSELPCTLATRDRCLLQVPLNTMCAHPHHRMAPTHPRPHSPLTPTHPRTLAL